MRASVFTDQALAKQAGRFVWLAVDTENPANAAFLEKHPWQAVPTFMVLDPNTEQPVYQWLGSANVEQLQRRFDEAEQAFKLAQGGAAGADALAAAQKLYTAGKYKEAADAYDKALTSGAVPADRRPHALETLVTAYSLAGLGEPCAVTAAKEAGGMPRGGSFLNVVASGLDCALSAPEKAPWRADAIRTLEPLAREGVTLPNLLDDDRSSLYGTLMQARSEQGDKDGAKQVATDWLNWLLGTQSKAASADARSALDGHLVVAAIGAGEPAKALPELESAERDLPNDYNPPARLARVYGEMGRLDDAVAAIDRALTKAYGPRKIGFYELKASLLEKKGDRTAARAALEDGLKYVDTLPKAQVRPQVVERLRQHAAKLG